MKLSDRSWKYAILCTALLAQGCSRGRLTLEPAVLSGCAAGHGEVVTVHWDVRARGVQNVQLYVQRPGGSERAWVRGRNPGSRKTGRWAADGMTFILRSGRHEFDRRTIETRPCPRPQKSE
jgi:hypothetical protein